MSSLNWFVLRAVSGQEKKIKSYIENEITRQKLNEFVPQILIPSEKIYEMRNGKKRVREKNFFPGYIIISADLSKGEVLHIITSIPGVIGFLGNAEG
jgi:transcriptional antiterminator NusG